MLASRHPGAGEMDAYERVLGDAMQGDATLFAREDYGRGGLAHRRPGAGAPTRRCSRYAPHSWGPAEAQRLAPRGGWHDPTPGTP